MNDSPSPKVQSNERAQYDERVGQVLGGKWSITTLLGIGGMAVVYGAMHKNGKRLAIKVLKREFADHPEAKERFLAEGYRANSVDHPAVVHALDDGVTADGLPFLVMDRLHGESLDQRMKREPLSELEALVVADRVLSALAVAEKAGVTHRDLKPDNFFLTAQHDIRLLDFGIAKGNDVSTKGGTAIGSIMGTPGYMSPEQASGQWDHVDARSDIFSVGAAMMALLIGRPPREGETVNFVLVAAMRDPLPSMASLRADLHPLVCGLIDRAVAQERALRFACAEEMRQAIAGAWAELSAVPIDVAHGSLFQGGGDSLRRPTSAPSYGPVRLPTSPSANGPTGTAYIGTGSSPSGPQATTPALGSGFGMQVQRSHYPSAPPQAMSVMAGAPSGRSIVPALLGALVVLAAMGIGAGVVVMKRAADAPAARAFGQVSSVARIADAPLPSAVDSPAPLRFSDLPELPSASASAPSRERPSAASTAVTPPVVSAPPAWLTSALPGTKEQPRAATAPSTTPAAAAVRPAATASPPQAQPKAPGAADPFDRRF